VFARLKPLAWPATIAVLAAVAYNVRIGNEMADFGVYRTAALRALDAQPLYVAADGHYAFKYLPAFACGMAPFALLRAETAKVIWFAMSVGLLVMLVRWSIFGLPERRHSVQVLGWLTVLFLAKFYAHELTLGQSNLLLGALLVAALLAVQIDKPVVGGVLIGIAAFVKPYALVLLPWLAVGYGVAGAAAAVGVVVAGLVLPALVYGWSGNLELLAGWYHTVAGSTVPTLLGADNISLAAMWAKWIGPGPLAAGLAAATAATAGGLAVAVWHRRARVHDPTYLEWALVMLLVPLLSPQGWDYVLLLGTPAVVCLVDRWGELSMRWRIVAGASLATMGLTVYDLMGRTLYSRFMALSLVSVAALGVAVALARLRWRELA
jgi:hypothetical protein